MKIMSIGYQGRSLAALCDALEASGARLLIDVRAAAWSQRPDFRKTALKNAVEARGIKYTHCKQAGNPFRPRKGEPVDPAACEAVYVQHLDAHPEVLDELESLMQDGPAALFCYEADRDACHRGVLLDALTARNKRVTIKDL